MGKPAAKRADQFDELVQMLSRDHRIQHRVPGRYQSRQTRHQCRNRPFLQRQSFQQQPIFVAEPHGAGQCGCKIRKAKDRFVPVPRGRQGHFDFDDQPVGAVGMVGEQHVVPAKLDIARVFFDAQKPDRRDIAAIAQQSPSDAADAARSAGDKTG